MNEKTKTSNFLDAINKYAAAQKKKMEKQLEAYKAEKVEQATEEGLKDAYDLIQNEISERRFAIVSETARMEQESKKELFALRRRMTDEIFSDAEKKLLDFTMTEKYTGKLMDYAEKVNALFLGEESVVYLAPKDMEFEEDVKKLVKNCTVKEDGSIRIGGLKAFCPSKGIIADNTYDAKLLDRKKWFVENAGLRVV